MKMTLFSAWGKQIAEYEGRTVMGLYSFVNLHASWHLAVFTDRMGKPVEILQRR